VPIAVDGMIPFWARSAGMKNALFMLKTLFRLKKEAEQTSFWVSRTGPRDRCTESRAKKDRPHAFWNNGV